MSTQIRKHPSRSPSPLARTKKELAAEKKALASDEKSLKSVAANVKQIDSFVSELSKLDPTNAALFQKDGATVVSQDRFEEQALKTKISADKKDVAKLTKQEKKLEAEAKKKADQVKQTVPGQVGAWIAQAQSILRKAGVPMSKMNASDINIIIQHESSGNPNAVNNWDSNAAAGHPSEGLMQTIGPTFNQYKLPGHDRILNPIDNIIAGVRYAIARYGSISNVPGVIDVHAGRGYVGY